MGRHLRRQVGSKSGAPEFELCSLTLVSEELAEAFEEEDDGGYIPWWVFTQNGI